MRRLCIALTVALGGGWVLPLDPAEARTRHHHVGKHHHLTKKFSHHRKSRGAHVSLAGVTPVLAAKARQIAASCGSTIVSAVSRRPNRSNHPIGRAVDMKGNPSCIYAQLKGWPGGYSTDYAAARHVHISYNPGGQEWGLRFAHGRSRNVRTTRVAYHNSRSRAAHYAYSSARRSRTVGAPLKSRAASSSRKSRPARSARLGASAYAGAPMLFAPARHNVH